MDYLPSKNFIKIVGFLLVVLGLGYLTLFLWNNRNTKTQIAQSTNKAKNTENIQNAQIDTDNDGLLDWEEALWRTNPEIVDTDGDETSDGEETKNGRDPKIAGVCNEKGCTDKLQNPEEITKNKNSDEPDTFTAKIAQEFGKNYFAGKGIVGGEALSTQTQQGLADSIVLGVEQGLAAYQDVFKKEDIKISKPLSPKIYLDDLGRAFSKNFKNIKTSEIDIINFIISSNYFDNVKLFDPLINSYKNMVLFLKSEVVSENYADLHLELLNIIQNTLFAVRSMKNIEEDPAKAIVGIRLYQKETGRTQEFLKSLKKRVEEDQINFAEKDGGYFFKKYFEKISN